MGHSFQYSKLRTPRETRLIKLRTDVERDTPLSCEIVTTSVDGPDPYVALSYTWGNETGRERMFVLASGEAVAEDAPAILVTPNCAAALRILRTCDLIRGRAVWVDAICINQASREDKSVQVGIMAEIYEKAAAVAVWLGKEWAPERYENVAASTAWYLNAACKLPDGKGSSEFIMGRVKHHVVRLALRGISQVVPKYLWFDLQTDLYYQTPTKSHSGTCLKHRTGNARGFCKRPPSRRP